MWLKRRHIILKLIWISCLVVHIFHRKKSMSYSPLMSVLFCCLVSVTLKGIQLYLLFLHSLIVYRFFQAERQNMFMWKSFKLSLVIQNWTLFWIVMLGMCYCLFKTIWFFLVGMGKRREEKPRPITITMCKLLFLTKEK